MNPTHALNSTVFIRTPDTTQQTFKAQYGRIVSVTFHQDGSETYGVLFPDGSIKQVPLAAIDSDNT